MARSASLSRADAESLLGPRGVLTINLDNRPLVRKWLVACGVASDVAGKLRMSDLADIYNDSTDSNLTAQCFGTTPNAATPEAPRNDATPSAVTSDKAEALQALLAIIAGQGSAGVNDDRVREIIRDELPDLIPVVRLEIKSGDNVVKFDAAARHKQFKTVIQVLSAGVPLFIVGEAGSGKTTAAEQAATALSKKFYLQGAISGAHELLGFIDAQGRYQTTPFRDAFENGGVMCLDEIDAGDASAILVLNSALANGHMPFPDKTQPVKRHPDFQVIACANTFGTGADRLYVGRNQLDAATLDRFYFLTWRYDEKLERAVAGDDSWCDRVQSLRGGATKEKARMVVSPRASIFGARLAASGMSRTDIEEGLVWKGADNELRRRIENSARA